MKIPNVAVPPAPQVFAGPAEFIEQHVDLELAPWQRWWVAALWPEITNRWEQQHHPRPLAIDGRAYAARRRARTRRNR